MKAGLTVGVALAALLTSPAMAKEVVLNGVTLEMPKGWKTEGKDGGSLLLKRDFAASDDEQAGGALIQAIAPQDGSLANLATNLADLVAAIPGMAEEDTTTDGTGVTSAGHDMIVQYRCCGRVEDVSAGLTSVAIGSAERQIYLQLLTMNLQDEREDEIEAAFATMVRTLRFEGDAQATALEPADGDGGLDGVYTFLRTGLMPNVFGGVDFTSDSEITLFDPKGLFSTAIPAGGDLAAHCAATPTDCGTYRVSGGGFWVGGEKTIKMRRMADEFGRMETQTLSFAEKGDNLVIDGEEHTKLPPFEAGTTLGGQWRYFFASSGMSATSSGSVAVEKLLTLTPDGRFERSGFAGGSSSVDTGSGTAGVSTASDAPAASGTYSIDGYGLTLTGDDGTSETLSLFAPDIGSDELLVIDGANYLKQD